MKRIIIIITVLSIVFSSSMGVWADSAPKDIEVILSDTPAVIKVGEIIALTASTQKHGSSYIDNWDTAAKNFTEFDSATETYISKALFTAEKPGIYNISYTITMTAGDSGNVFSKKVQRTIEVIDPITVIGAVIKDLTVTPVYNADGSISFYSACGTVHALWSNNTTTPNGSIFFFFGPNETTKDINVTLCINDKQYNYIVTVNR